MGPGWVRAVQPSADALIGAEVANAYHSPHDGYPPVATYGYSADYSPPTEIIYDSGRRGPFGYGYRRDWW